MYVCKLWPGYHRQSWGSVRTAPAPPRSNRRRESWRGSGRARRSSLGGTTSPLTTATRRPSRAVPSRDRVMTFPQFGYVSLSSPTLAKTGLCKLRLLNGVICGLVSILVGGPGGLSVVVTVNPATPDPGPALHESRIRLFVDFLCFECTTLCTTIISKPWSQVPIFLWRQDIKPYQQHYISFSSKSEFSYLSLMSYLLSLVRTHNTYFLTLNKIQVSWPSKIAKFKPRKSQPRFRFKTNIPVSSTWNWKCPRTCTRSPYEIGR